MKRALIVALAAAVPAAVVFAVSPHDAPIEAPTVRNAGNVVNIRRTDSVTVNQGFLSSSDRLYLMGVVRDANEMFHKAAK